MASTFNRAMQTQGAGKGKVVVGEKPEPKPGQVGVKIAAAIFFDGTGNNENNIKRRLKDSAYKNPGFFTSDDSRASYAQYYSNVAILHFMHKKNIAGERIASVYIEGIGTTNDDDDDTPGSGFGSGPTGIVDRVSDGINRLAAKVNKLYDKPNKDEYIEELTVCVFGFSRGAAAARHFIARRFTSRKRINNLCDRLGVKPAVVTIKFAGLFDSVSSFDENQYKLGDLAGKVVGHGWDSDKNFLNDVSELHLTLDDDDKLLKVVHLAAADEYRLNFSLTTIGSAVHKGTGVEILLPGAHSDIGGGYAQHVTEERKYEWESKLKFFRDQGWYGKEQLVTAQRKVAMERGMSYTETTTTGTRQLPNTYQYVALSVMLKLAKLANSGMQFGNPNEDEERGIRYIINASSPLYTIKSKLESYALRQYTGPHTEIPLFPKPLPVCPALSEEEYKWLRQHYLHLSWSDKLGFEYRLQKGSISQPVRLILAG
jgi:Uncharacterized alpha/beta hydrolase domain (DUF2235)